METAYEAIFIVDTNLSDEQYSTITEKYTGIITTGGGTVDDVDRMEARRLAYEVKGRREGQYYLVNFRSEPAAKDEMERIFRISDDVIRYMVIKQDKRADRFPSKIRAAEQERRDREMAARAAANPPIQQPAVEQQVTDLSASAPTGGVENANGVTDGHENVDQPITAPLDNTLADTESEEAPTALTVETVEDVA